MEERRRKPRVKKSLIVQYSKDGRVWDMSKAIDFSEVGALIVTNGKLAVGDIINLRARIPLDPLNWLEFSGKVVDCLELCSPRGAPVLGEYITRVELIIAEERRALLKKYVEWLTNKK